MLTRSKARAQAKEEAKTASEGTVHLHDVDPALRQAAEIAQMDPNDSLTVFASIAAVMPPQKDTGRNGLDLLVAATEIATHPVATTITPEDRGSQRLDILALAASTLEAARTDASDRKKRGREAEDDIANKVARVGEDITADVADARAQAGAKNQEQHEEKSAALPSRSSRARKVAPKVAAPQASGSNAANAASSGPSRDTTKSSKAGTRKILLCTSPACTFSTSQPSKMKEHIGVHNGPHVCNAPIDDPLFNNRCPYRHRNLGKLSEHRSRAHGIKSEKSKRARKVQESGNQGTENVAPLAEAAAPAVEDPSAAISAVSEKPNAPSPKAGRNIRIISHNAAA